MGVKLLGLPRECMDTLKWECRERGIRPAEFFKEVGHEIRSLAELREWRLWFMVPSGNTFIYKALGWLSRSPVTDEDEIVPDSMCCKASIQGQRCVREVGHENDPDPKKRPHRTMVWFEF